MCLSATVPSCLGIQADASLETDQRKAVAQTINRYGSLDVLINNAGISMRAMFKDVDLEVIRKVMEINFFGTVYATKAALPYILKSKGSIVGISSIAGYKGLPGRTGYSASKFAMMGFLESLEIELLKEFRTKARKALKLGSVGMHHQKLMDKVQAKPHLSVDGVAARFCFV